MQKQYESLYFSWIKKQKGRANLIVPCKTPWNRHRTKNLIILMLIIQSPRQQTNRPAQHHPVKSRPAWNSRIFLKSTMPRGADPETLPSITLGPEFPIGQYSSHYQRNQTKREKVRLKGVSDGRAVLPRQEPEIDEGNVPD